MAEKIELSISANVSEAMKEVAGFSKQYADMVREVEKPLRQVNGFRELESSLEQTGRKMREARDRVRELGNAMAAAATPSQSLSAEYQQAVSSLKALERQEASQIGQLGKMRTEGAARLAVEAYGEAMQSRAAQVVENLGYLQTAWRAVGKVSSEAWDAMLDLGRTDTLEEKLAKVERDLQQRARSIYTALRSIPVRARRRWSGAGPN
ncbi:phage tail tape measure protein [Azotobacter beijerinckii]|uniref:Phage tail tape measure protein n=1 Tax=Azotobacter beijerinckii TaxID=170623 RepID=A0A1I3Z542_9GAMM|nr:phage tail tape measure protein [Azotobacter beijerinckii]SFA72924.1 hypothetical protein SAMN04244571_00152 [Azotobacter beijerinckii]SFK38666.1 hypothetical protein SAMN04244574_00427 [Azotobacter beijerinckii]